MANLNPSTLLHKIVTSQARPRIGMPPVTGIGGLAARMRAIDLKKIVILLREPNGNDFSRSTKNTNKPSLPQSKKGFMPFFASYVDKAFDILQATCVIYFV